MKHTLSLRPISKNVAPEATQKALSLIRCLNQDGLQEALEGLADNTGQKILLQEADQAVLRLIRVTADKIGKSKNPDALKTAERLSRGLVHYCTARALIISRREG